MSLKLRYFTVTEAESLLPQIMELLTEARATKTMIEKKVDAWRKIHKKIKPADEAVMRGQVDFMASQLEAQLNKIAALGCIPKDLDQGLIDFPARIDNREGYLCWKVGEGKIRFWHNLTDGYAGRKPLRAKEA